MAAWLLLVEDDTDSREGLAELLALSGFETVACAAPAEAHAILDSRGRPNLVLADLLMPGVTGTDFVRAMRDRSGFGDVPVVFVTGVEPSSLADVRDPEIKKPLDFDRLLGLVERHCGPG